MTYLLTLGWPWFAAAFAIGAGVGFVSYSRARDVQFSGGWVIVAGALALASAFAASAAEIFSGRDAVTLDIALLAGLAYAAGLPAGGVLKSLGGGEAPSRTRPERAPIIVAPAAVAAAPVAAFAPAAVAQAEAPPRSAETPSSAPAETPASAPARAPRAAKSAAAGVRPETLEAPRGGVADDLSRIKGLGPKSREKLNALGVFHFDQIASWNLDNARWIGAAIGAPGRVERGKWIQQARALAGPGTDQ
jgi:predicted flap endonuclease-1-like 5' DNA nuclease